MLFCLIWSPCCGIKQHIVKKGTSFLGLGLALVLSAIFAANLPAQTSAGHKHDYSKEPAVFESLNTTVRFENDGTVTREVAARVRIQSDAGVKDYGLLEFAYDSANQKLKILYVRVIKPDGKVVITPSSDFQDVTSAISRAAPMYSDYREKHVAVKGLDTGDELEYATQVKVVKPLVPGQFWFAFDFLDSQIVLNEELDVSTPKDRKIIVKSPGLKSETSEQDNRIVYIWKTENLEDKTPQSVRPGYQPPPAVEITSFQNWNEVGRWWGRLEQKEMKPTPAIRAKALELTKGATTDQEKVHAIYKYVAEQFRYISISFGIGRYRPHAATDILTNQYGDCKDKHTLLASLLAAVGLKAYPALIIATNKLDPDVPSPEQFDHVISYVPLGAKGLWLDTTAEVAPEGFLVPGLRHKKALLIPDGKPAYLVETPSTPPFQSFQRFESDGKLSSDGTFTGKIQRTARGYTGLVLQLLFRNASQDQWQKLVQGISSLIGFGGTVSNVTTSSTDDIDHPFSYSYNYTRKNYGDWADDKTVAALPPFGLPDAKESKGKVPAPIYFNGPSNFLYTSKIDLPKGYAPQLPKPIDLKFDFADYHSSCTFKNGVLTISRTLSIKTDELPAASRKEYAKLEKTVSNDERQFITLDHGQPTAQAAINPEALKMYNQAMQTARLGDRRDAEDLIQRALRLDPKFERAWVVEGEFHEFRGETDEGIADLRKAIALNPKDPLPYRGLAFILVNQGKRKEAIQTLQNLLKLDPKDGPAQVMLGKLFLDSGEYVKALPQFEKALPAEQGNPLLEVDVALAYTGMGDGAKAAEAFKKATADDPTRRIWNKAAKSLAKFDQQLPEAQHYAEMAVKDDEAKAAKIEIANAGSDDLTLMGNMASDWDALGWVYFKEKNLVEARKYLAAAWNLSQAESVGDHLGQIYEKLGNKQEAIKMYEMACGSTPIGGKSDARTRLSRLLGVPGNKLDLRLFQAGQENIKGLKVKLGRISSAEGSAEVLILFSPGSKIVGLKFTSGDAPLKTLGNAIRSARYHIMFPDSSTTQILRHGVLVCVGRSFGCDLTLTTERPAHEIPSE
jgi:tetratricopeptide (TPR) repeat protein